MWKVLKNSAFYYFFVIFFLYIITLVNTILLRFFYFMYKYSKEFLKSTIQIWQPFSDIPLSSKDAIEITENITDLFNFLITEEKKSQDKSVIPNNICFKNKTGKKVKK